MGIAAPGSPEQETAAGQTRAPSGLFPAGPPRRAYREPHPVRPWSVLAGLTAGLAWLGLFVLLGDDVPSHIWWLVAAGVAGWLVALALVRYGDRGVAVGVAMATGLGWAAGAGLVVLRWSITGEWPLW